MEIFRHKNYITPYRASMETRIQGELDGEFLFEYAIEFPSHLKASKMIEMGEILQEAFGKCEKIINEKENLVP